MTIVLSIGVTNMSRRGAVIRRLTAVETLGCAQVICSDKTGTLTQKPHDCDGVRGQRRTPARHGHGPVRGRGA
ncbi:P-ATPase superfamily P-type ATPase cation transporter [human gut metagenome]|uniref:p-ATPase superfamily P-type ATPase cation transporter n=1 Tax=human gut metagenome TaxID=408170 RepID=K1S9R8_9ZZZZ